MKVTNQKLNAQDKTILISLKIPRRLWTAFKQATKADGYAASEVVRMLMAYYMDED